MAYDAIITGKKMLVQLGFVLLSGALTAGIDFCTGMGTAGDFSVFAILLMLFKGAENYLKHYKK